jgi:ABC-type transporter Mla subunit MlaD
MMTFRVPEELAREIESLASGHGLSVSSFLRAIAAGAVSLPHLADDDARWLADAVRTGRRVWAEGNAFNVTAEAVDRAAAQVESALSAAAQLQRSVEGLELAREVLRRHGATIVHQLLEDPEFQIPDP